MTEHEIRRVYTDGRLHGLMESLKIVEDLVLESIKKGDHEGHDKLSEACCLIDKRIAGVPMGQ